MARFIPQDRQATSTQQQPTRKIGFVTQRLDADANTQADKPDAEQVPYLITDWASI